MINKTWAERSPKEREQIEAARSAATYNNSQLKADEDTGTETHITQEAAERKTGLYGREFPGALCDFLRCQLGRVVKVKMDILDHSTGKTENVTVDFFHLIAFGHTWRRAAEQFLETRSKLK